MQIIHVIILVRYVYAYIYIYIYVQNILNKCLKINHNKIKTLLYNHNNIGFL